MNKTANVVFIAAPNIGNLVPAVEFATQLTITYPNLTATVLVITTNRSSLVDTFVDSRSTVNSGNVSFIHLPSMDPPSSDKYQTSVGFRSLLIQNQKPHVKNALVNIMQTRSGSTNSAVPLAGFFVDMFCTSMIDVANELGVKSYIYFASPASFLGFMLHLPVLTQQSTELGGELKIPGFVKPVPVSALPTFFLARNEDDGCSWFLYNAKKYKEAKGIIVNTFRELEDHALHSLSTEFSDLPSVYPVGPVIDRRGPAGWNSNPAHEDVKMWLDQQPKASVVFLCFGSRGSLKQVQVKEIAHGLEQSGHRFLWSLLEPGKGDLDLPGNHTNSDTVLPEGFIDRTAGIGLVCGWVPQVIVLGHIAVGGFVSHCGWNSTLESLWHGVPIATWPIYAEQQLNAFELVKELKLSVEISLDYRGGEKDLVSREDVAKGVKSLMEFDDYGQEIREKVNKISQVSKKAVMKDGSSFVALAKLVDQLLADI
ncbi:Glycosyltransferase [Heracleum sosnowskyi]|uniref:Glycosyltransferase n=1 Tax=Heracleum sosnowskyi TaxID=360622 RepID=A0AAD8I0E3_9APIA|nr:Glycosyltransferase [Heracleum sosnowskyi]